MLHHAGKWVVIGIETDNPHAPAMVCEWNDDTRKGRLLLEELPAVIEARHDDTASKVRAQAEKRRVRAVADSHVIPDLDGWVKADRARIMAEMGHPEPAAAAVAKVTRLTAGGPFPPAAALHKPAEKNPGTKTDEYLSLKAEGERAVSGGTR